MNKLMMRLIRVGLLAVPAMLMGSVAYAAPNDGVCDELKGLGKGLHGLCVAFCEAQDCIATFDPDLNELIFPKNCVPSSEKTLARYNARKGESDPPMPCVIEGCPCWSEAEIDLVADGVTQGCVDEPSFTVLIGLDGTVGGQEAAGTKIDGSLLQCFYQERTPEPGIIRFLPIDSDEHGFCDELVKIECNNRGFLLP